MPSVNVGSDSNVLTGAWAASSDDVWAVGYYGDQRFDASETLAQHWDGSRWSLVPTPVPGPGPGGNFFNGISGTSGDDVWAVGDYATGLPLVLNLIEHWDGSEWSVVPSPNNGSGSNLLEAVSAVSPTDAWAVGFYVDGFGDHDLIEHWDGSAWTIVRAPQYQGEPVLYGVAFRSGDDGWAAGWKDGVDQEEKDTLVEHWDGVGWSASGAVDPGFQNNLFAVAAVSGSDVIAAGRASPSVGLIRTLVETWDGAAWVRAPSPNPGNAYNSLAGVWADASSGRAWAVGSFYDAPTSEYRTLTERWDGTRWRAVSAPNPSDTSDELLSVSAASMVDAWAVGRSIDGVYRTLIEHFC